MQTLLEFNFFSFFTYAMKDALQTKWWVLHWSGTLIYLLALHTHPPAAKQLKASWP